MSGEVWLIWWRQHGTPIVDEYDSLDAALSQAAYSSLDACSRSPEMIEGPVGSDGWTAYKGAQLTDMILEYDGNRPAPAPRPPTVGRILIRAPELGPWVQWDSYSDGEKLIAEEARLVVLLGRARVTMELAPAPEPRAMIGG